MMPAVPAGVPVAAALTASDYGIRGSPGVRSLQVYEQLDPVFQGVLRGLLLGFGKRQPACRFQPPATAGGSFPAIPDS